VLPTRKVYGVDGLHAKLKSWRQGWSLERRPAGDATVCTEQTHFAPHEHRIDESIGAPFSSAQSKRPRDLVILRTADLLSISVTEHFPAAGTGRDAARLDPWLIRIASRSRDMIGLSAQQTPLNGI